MGAVQDVVEQFLSDAELTHDDLDSVLNAVRHHFGEFVHVTDPAMVGEHIYLSPEDRFVATLSVSYDPDSDGVVSSEEALRAALNLTRDDGESGTHWWVYDRDIGKGRIIEQGDVADTPMPGLVL